MKISDILILAAAGAVAWVLLRNKGSGAAPAGTTLVKEYDGWRYYSDGTVIDRYGSYYYQGEKVFDGTWGAV